LTADGGGRNFCAMENTTAPLTTGAPPSGVTTGRDRLGAALLLGVGGLLAVLSVYLCRPPTVQPATAPVTAFSTERAFHHVAAIAQRPHPNQSSAIEAVRDYLLGEMQKLGLQPLVQRATVQRGGNRPDMPVENILVRKSGTMNSRAVMLVAHYDTVSRSPGAADDGAAVAALLETLRALNASPPLRNDVAGCGVGEPIGLSGMDRAAVGLSRAGATLRAGAGTGIAVRRGACARLRKKRLAACRTWSSTLLNKMAAPFWRRSSGAGIFRFSRPR